MVKFQRFFTFLTFLLTLISISAQIKIKELPSYDLLPADSLFFGVNDFRKVINLRDNWQVHSPGAPQKTVNVSVPSTFEGEESLIYERKISISSDQAKNKTLTLHFLGVNYTADVLLNDLVIYKHPGGIQPFDVTLPYDILKPNEENKLTVKVQFALDDIGTIPVLQRFLFPSDRGGIISDVYLSLTNKIYVGKIDIQSTVAQNMKTASLKINTTVNNNKKRSSQSTQVEPDNYELNYVLKSQAGEKTYSKELNNIQTRDAVETQFDIGIESPLFWSPENPQSYFLEISITHNDSVIDKTTKSVSLYNISNEPAGLTLNGSDLEIKGTTYFYSESESGGLVSYNKLELDLRLIKEAGFNTVRFSKVLPPAYALRFCETIGLFALVELPVNSVPVQILASEDFSSRVTNHLSLMADAYDDYFSVLAFGLGGGYIGTDPEQREFLRIQSELLKAQTNKLTYASFISLPKSEINSLDLYGIELFSASEEQLTALNSEVQLADFDVFISEATYPSFNGNSNGYLNKNSFEAAAKYYSDIIDFAKINKLNGFVLNSIYDYKGDYKSFYTGYNKNYYYSVGLLPSSETIDRISYKVVKSKLTDAEKITIPIGTTKDDSPILFVIIGLVLSIFMALLINSKRKFREDASRSLIRPYNFFADIRDHRLLSGFQTNLLMFILAGSLSLLAINLLHFLRTNLFVEKVLLSFGLQSLIDVIIYIAWNPLNGFLIFFAVIVTSFVLLSMLIKVFSFFLKNKVFFSSIYYSVIWSLLPLSLLLPLELVLYRVLIANIVNVYVYLFIILYSFWLVQRLLKGIHVIFDVRKSTVYIYGVAVIIIFVGGILVYFQLANSTVYHLLRAVSEYKFL